MTSSAEKICIRAEIMKGFRNISIPFLLSLFFAFSLLTASASGAVIPATPSNYLSLLATLHPGDTLLLAQGNYHGLPIVNVNGAPGNPITVSGPEAGDRPVILGRSGISTIRLDHSSYVVIRNLEVNCLTRGGDGVNSQGITHHITLENLYIHGFSDDQGTVGISTNRAPVWNWVIRNNIITDGGTGVYLGNSDGNMPFIAGTIENNLIYNTIGYNIEIKQQNPRPTNIPGMTTGDNGTIIRNNVFSKANNSSTGNRARPNLLVGHWPLSGSGMNDVYEIYGNFFYQNPTGEPLFQGEGNIALYNNLFFNSVGEGIWIQPHHDVPRTIRVFYNTVVTRDSGIKVTGGSASYQQKVIGNAAFSANPIQASEKSDNITDSYQNASLYLNNPFGNLGQKGLFPKVGKLKGGPINTSPFNSFRDWNRDFNFNLHDGIFRGAYAGEGQNPGWLPKLERKPAITSEPNPPSPPMPPRIQ